MTTPSNIQFGFILTRVLCLDETTLPSVSQGTCAVSDRGSDCTRQAGVTDLQQYDETLANEGAS